MNPNELVQPVARAADVESEADRLLLAAWQNTWQKRFERLATVEDKTIAEIARLRDAVEMAIAFIEPENQPPQYTREQVMFHLRAALEDSADGD